MSQSEYGDLAGEGNKAEISFLVGDRISEPVYLAGPLKRREGGKKIG